MTFYYKTIERLDLGLGNPNWAGVLIAMAMIASLWGIGWRNHFAKWISAISFLGLGVLLIKSYSRGAFLACLVGNLALYLLGNPGFRKDYLRYIPIMIVLLGAWLFKASALERCLRAPVDSSVLNRLAIWRTVPQMLLDAPGGWGGTSHEAYMQWYQSTERPEEFLNLVSFHLVVLLASGWGFRYCYLALWCSLFNILFKNKKDSKAVFAFAIMTVFFVGGIFTHFSDCWIVYFTPALTAVFSLRYIFRESMQNNLKLIGQSAFLSMTILLIIIPLGNGTRRFELYGARTSVAVGSTHPDTWIIPDSKVLGRHYGKIYRSYFESNKNVSAFGFAKDLKCIKEANLIVLTGDIGEDDLSELRRINPRKVVVVNPRFAVNLLKGTDLRFALIPVIGEFYSSKHKEGWISLDNGIKLPGCGNFISDWPSVIESLAPSVHGIDRDGF